MSLLRFLRVLIARRALVMAAAAGCLAGAFALTFVLPAQWTAHARVMMDTLRPDPVSGVVIEGQQQQQYVATQSELILDYTVASRAVAQLGWLSDPVRISQYHRRSASDHRDLQHWLAQRLIDHTKVKVLEGSNILDIAFSGPTPDEARRVVDAIRTSYLDASLAFKRDTAARDAAWWQAQAVLAKAALDEAQKAETDFERANGVVLTDQNTDIDTARLRALSSDVQRPQPTAATAVSPSANQLAQLDARIAEDSQTLGPNHPELLRLRAERAALAKEAAADAAATRSAGVGVSLERELAQEKARVIAQGDKLKTVEMLQAQADLRRDQFTKASAKAAELQQAANASDIGLTPLGAALTPQRPAFPSRSVVIPLSLVLGLAIGVLAALLIELIWPRLRGPEDLLLAVDAPVLAVFPSAHKPGLAETQRLRFRTQRFPRLRLTAPL
jgi:succinoglycan biosynthesis transport protein ExoP